MYGLTIVKNSTNKSVEIVLFSIDNHTVFLFSAERARPYLVTQDSSDSTDYINAVYVDVSK